MLILEFQAVHWWNWDAKVREIRRESEKCELFSCFYFNVAYRQIFLTFFDKHWLSFINYR